MEISIIVPVYNVEKYLPKCLESLISQDKCVKEIILVNDGSTDNSLQVCKRYAEIDSRIRIIDRENGGVPAVICAGVAAATCDYIGFADGDDYVEPDMFRKMADQMEKSGADVVICNFDTVNEDGAKRSAGNPMINSLDSVLVKEDGAFSAQILPTVKNVTFVSGFRWNKLFKKKAIVENIAFFDSKIRHGEDIALTVPVVFASEKIACVHESLYHYLQRSTSIVHTYKRQNLHDWKAVVDILDKARCEYDYKIKDFDDVSLGLLLSLCFRKIRLSSLSRRQRREEYKFIGKDEEVRRLLSAVKFKTNWKYKTVLTLMKHKMYGLLSLIY